MFLKSLCATSPASIDPTWKIRRHIATEAYMLFKVSARRHLHPSSSHGRYDVYRNGGLYVFDKSLRDVTCIHRPHKEDTTSHHNGGLYVFDKTCATSPASIDYTWKIRSHIATDAYMFLKTSPASIDPTCTIRRHIATEAYMF